MAGSRERPIGVLLLPLHSRLSELDAFSDQLVPTAELAEDPLSAFGSFVAVAPRATDPPSYAELIESIHEGFLSHYGSPRLLRDGVDGELTLLAGDYLYALGLERLAALGDSEAVAELSDLISLQALLHADGVPVSPEHEILSRALWVAAIVAVGFGGDSELESMKAGLPACSDPGELAARLRAWANSRVAGAGVDEAWAQVAEQVGFDFEVN